MDGEPLYYTNENGEKTYLLENGEKVVGNFDPKLLGEIATMTDARYFTADNISELQRVFDEIQELTDSGTESVYAEKKISLTPYFALVLAGLFVAILFCERNFRKKYGVV